MYVRGQILLIQTRLFALGANGCFYRQLLDPVEYEERDWVSIFSTYSGFVGTPTVESEEKWHKMVDSMSSSLLKRPPHFDKKRRTLTLKNSARRLHPPRAHLLPLPQHRTRFRRSRTARPARLHRRPVEVFHHLHCLNVVRHFASRDVYETPRV